MVKAESYDEDSSLVSTLSHPQVKKTKQHPCCARSALCSCTYKVRA